MFVLMLLLLVGSLALAVGGALYAWSTLEAWLREGTDPTIGRISEPSQRGGNLRRERES